MILGLMILSKASEEAEALADVRGSEDPVRVGGGGWGWSVCGRFADPKWTSWFCHGMDGLAARG